jgi:ribosomal-protein-alanine N-acetyltransferase
MCKEDIPQVLEIDREAFPTLWPPPNYRRELENRLAHYLVAGDEGEMVVEPEVKASPQKDSSGLISRLRRLFNNEPSSGNEITSSGRQYIFGFTGFWIMAGEAHITTIAVREKHRRQGIGELLLISLIDLATELDASLITLEVRASNIAAQSLYSKYGFGWVGVRRGYYTDNREDGVLMSLENITSAQVQANLQRLKEAHSQRRRIVGNFLKARDY